MLDQIMLSRPQRFIASRYCFSHICITSVILVLPFFLRLFKDKWSLNAYNSTLYAYIAQYLPIYIYNYFLIFNTVACDYTSLRIQRNNHSLTKISNFSSSNLASSSSKFDLLYRNWQEQI